MSREPRRACRDRARYKTEDSARNHHRARFGGRAVVKCEACGGWHHVPRPAVKAVGS